MELVFRCDTMVVDTVGVAVPEVDLQEMADVPVVTTLLTPTDPLTPNVPLNGPGYTSTNQSDVTYRP